MMAFRADTEIAIMWDEPPYAYGGPATPSNIRAVIPGTVHDRQGIPGE